MTSNPGSLAMPVFADLSEFLYLRIFWSIHSRIQCPRRKTIHKNFGKYLLIKVFFSLE